MANYSFEMGFDWNVPPSGGALEIIYALQMCLVDDQEGVVISPCNASKLKIGDTLSFRLYDFTDPAEPAPANALPQALQVVFAWATNDKSSFSPFQDEGSQLPQLATTQFVAIPPVNNGVTSVAYGKVGRGWDVTMSPALPLNFENAGRYELRAVVTLALPGVMARFYKIDPEIVIGDGGPGPNK